MKQSYKDLLNQAYAKKPHALLTDRIEAHIRTEQVFRARYRAYSYATISLIALCALVPATNYVLGQAHQSGLSEYISLFISDSGYVFNNLKEVAFSIIESAPVLGIAYVLASLLVTSYAARKAVIYVRSVRTTIYSLSL